MMLIGGGVDWLRGWLGGNDDGAHAVHYRDAAGVRRLYLGDSETIQSAMRLSDPVRLELAYTRAMLCSLLFRPDPRRALVLGLGGGSLAKYIHHRLPECTQEAVDANPDVIAIARAHFALPADDDRLTVTLGDAAAHVAGRATDPVDLLLVDVYDERRQVAACATGAFFAAAAAALTREGVCAVNFWSNAPEYPVYRDRFLDAFGGRVLLLPVARPGNMIAFGFASADGDWRWQHLRARARLLEPLHGIEFGAFVEGLRQANPYSENRLLI
jgi:spermidine synthase